MFNKHTEYAISVKTTMENYPVDNLKVNRRYSDFEWLFNRLTRTFPGRVIPPIPEKQSRNRFDKDFVEGRRLALQKFIDEVTRDPTFAVTYDVQVFLTASSEGMSAARSIMPGGDGAVLDIVNKAVAATRSGVNKVIESTTGNAIDMVDQTAEFGDVEYNLVKYSEQMKKVISAGERMVASEANAAKAWIDMSGSFSQFVVVARTFETVDGLGLLHEGVRQPEGDRQLREVRQQRAERGPDHRSAHVQRQGHVRVPGHPQPRPRHEGDREGGEGDRQGQGQGAGGQGGGQEGREEGQGGRGEGQGEERREGEGLGRRAAGSEGRSGVLPQGPREAGHRVPAALHGAARGLLR